MSTAPVVYEGTQLLEDLELLCGKQQACQQYAASILQRAQTTYGAVSTGLLLALPQTNLTLLKQRQDAVKMLSDTSQLYTNCRTILSTLAQHQAETISLLKNDMLTRVVHDTRVFQMKPFTLLNRSRWGLLFHHIRSVVIGAVSTGLGCWAGYKALQYVLHQLWHKGILRKQEEQYVPPLSQDASFLQQAQQQLGSFTKQDAEEVDGACGHTYDYFLRYIWKKTTNTAIRAGIAGISSYTLFYSVLYWWDSFRANLLQDKMIYRGMMGLATSVRQAELLYTQLKQHDVWRSLPGCAPLFDFFENALQTNDSVKKFFSMLSSSSFHPKYGHRFDAGVIVRAYLLLDACGPEILNLLAAVGRVDAYCGIAALMQEQRPDGNQFCFVDYGTSQPELCIKGLWNPLLSSAGAVPSDIMLGKKTKHDHFIITGPNAGGKSTLLKGAALAAVMAQTCGIVPGTSSKMSPFAVIETYLNITDDLQEGNSLFKKEVMRAGELIRRSDAHRSLLLFDEMFNGTTPYEGVSCAYSVIDHLAQRPLVITLVATHFEYLTHLAERYPRVAAMQVGMMPVRGGREWQRTYTLEPGISGHHIALDMLAEEGVELDVIRSAQTVLKKVSKQMLPASRTS